MSISPEPDVHLVSHFRIADPLKHGLLPRNFIFLFREGTFLKLPVKISQIPGLIIHPDHGNASRVFNSSNSCRSSDPVKFAPLFHLADLIFGYSGVGAVIGTIKFFCVCTLKFDLAVPERGDC